MAVVVRFGSTRSSKGLAFTDCIWHPAIFNRLPMAWLWRTGRAPARDSIPACLSGKNHDAFRRGELQGRKGTPVERRFRINPAGQWYAKKSTAGQASSGTRRKYNEAIQEMLEYAKQGGQLPGR
jgi:hypothetical protein